MNQPLENSSASPATRKPNVLLTIVKPMVCVAGGVGIGFVVVMGVVCWLLFVAAPGVLNWIYHVLGS